MDIIEKLRNAGVEVTHNKRMICPNHDDTTPSLTIGDGFAKCYVCDFKISHKELLKTYGVAPEQKYIQGQTVEKFHQEIWSRQESLNELYKRQLTDELIKFYKIGYCADRKRITIPIANEEGMFINVRYYSPGSSERKFFDAAGFTTNTIFPVGQLTYNKLLITGGELKAINAAYRLNAEGIGCICRTGGENQNWDEDFSSKIVYICMDIDRAGVTATERVAKCLAGSCKELHTCSLPLNIDEFPAGDINDFKGDLLKVIKDAKPYVMEGYLHRGLKEPIDSHLSMVSDGTRVDERIKVKGVIEAVAEASYSMPRELTIRCDKSSKYCGLCAFHSCPTEQLSVFPESDTIAGFVNASKEKEDQLLKREFDIPDQCSKVEFEINGYHSVEDVRVSEEIAVDPSQEYSNRLYRFLIVSNNGDKIKENEVHELAGTIVRSPRTNATMCVSSDYKVSSDALASTEIGDTRDLSVFQSDEIQGKLQKIYTDLSENITHIYGRMDLHLICDLIWHSPLYITLGKEGIIPGWTQGLVIGDSAQGKTATSSALIKHYGLGTRVDAKNSTVAGMLGGAIKMGDQWLIRWGTIPRNDKRLVVIEELKGKGANVFSSLTEMRSSGVAHVTKISEHKVHARTRLLVLSNPVTGTSMASYSYGVHAIQKLIANPEDIRRFDICCLVNASDNVLRSEDLIDRPQVEHKYTSELCHKLILWAWKLLPEQVVISGDTYRYLCIKSQELAGNFCDDIPLLDFGSVRTKVAKLSAALACRLFSTTDEGRTLCISDKHVDFICTLLSRLYSGHNFGFRRYTDWIRTREVLTDKEKVKALITEKGESFIRGLSGYDVLTQDTFNALIGDLDLSRNIVSCLVTSNALIMEGREFRKTVGLVNLLKELENDN